MAVIPSPIVGTTVGLPLTGGTLTGNLSLGTNILFAQAATLTSDSVATEIITNATIATASIGTSIT